MLREYLRMAARSLHAHRFRSGLTVSSITLGAFSIVLMSSLASSGLSTLARDIEELGGARIILIAPKQPERVTHRLGLGDNGLTRRDREILYRSLPHTTARAAYATLGKKDATNARGDERRTDLVAADAGFFEALNLKVASGRAWSEAEDRRHARVCVIALKVAEIFPDGALGRWLTIDGERCEVIGVLAPADHWDTNFGFEWLDFVAMPLDTVAEDRPEVEREVLVQLRTDHVEHNDIVKRIANAILVDRHHGVDDFQIWDFNAFMAQFEALFRMMEMVVGAIAGIALLVGGIGVMNMMLVSVSERTREIGLRKALGASPRAIAAQFLAEATVLAGGGGVAGAIVGVAAAAVANLGITQLKSMWVAEISWPAVSIAVCASLAIGLAFGSGPAFRASLLTPVEAMRR